MSFPALSMNSPSLIPTLPLCAVGATVEATWLQRLFRSPAKGSPPPDSGGLLPAPMSDIEAVGGDEEDPPRTRRGQAGGIPRIMGSGSNPTDSWPNSSASFTSLPEPHNLSPVRTGKPLKKTLLTWSMESTF